MTMSSLAAGFDVHISEAELQKRVKALGAAITADYLGKQLVVVGVLKGSFVFLADLVRAIDLPVKVDFMGITSYEGTKSTGVVRVTSDLSRPVEGQHLLLVEDIVDTGLTISHLLQLFRTRMPNSVKVCSLLHKPARARVEVPIHYLGFTIEDKFVVGYGLDWAERYRNLPYIGVVEAQ